MSEYLQSEDAQLALADRLAKQGQAEEALKSYRSILERNPRCAPAYWKTGVVLHQLGRRQEAIQQCLQALNVNPNADEACYTLGKILRDMQMLAEAITCFRKTIGLNPNHASALNALGAALYEIHNNEEAALCLEQAIALDPGYAGAHYNLGLVLLLRGDYSRGWQEFEWRWKSDAFRALRRDFPQPQWRGEALEGGTILLHAEQGLGDTLQFVRFIPEVQARGGRVIVECQPELQMLLSGVLQGCQVLSKGDPLPPFDLHCPLLSLPLVFGTTLKTIPGSVPYLWAESEKIEKWRAKVADNRGRLKVGLVWASGKGVLQHKKSISLAALAPLARITAATFYSLQKNKPEVSPGPDTDATAGLQLVDYSAEFTDFAETAALVANLDLVISIDTSVAHLVGAMGKPVWVLQAGFADWRWLPNREDSPWYPTMRLFDYRKKGGWEETVDRVTEALSLWVESSTVS